MIRNSRAWRMTIWDYAVETMFSAVEFLLSNAICGTGTMIAGGWFAGYLGWGSGLSFLDAFTICAAIDLLVYRLLPNEPDRNLGRSYMEVLARMVVRDVLSTTATLGVCGILILCVHYL